MEKEGNMHVPSLAGTAEENTNAHLVADASPLGATVLQYVPEGTFIKHQKTHRSHKMTIPHY